MIQHSCTGRVLPGVNRPASADRPIAIHATSLDHQALDGAAKIAVDHRRAAPSRVPAPSGPIQDSASSRIHSPTGSPREIDGEIGVEKRPLPEIQHRRGAVAEIRGDHRPHRLRHRRAFDDRPVDSVPDRAGTGHAEPAAGGAQRHAGHERAAGKIRGLARDCAGPGSSTGDISASGGNSFACTLIFRHGGADHDHAFGAKPDRRKAGSCGPRARFRSRSSAARPAPGASRSTLTRAIRIGTGVGIASAAQATSAAGGEPCCMFGSQGPAALGLVEDAVAVHAKDSVHQRAFSKRITWMPNIRSPASPETGHDVAVIVQPFVDRGGQIGTSGCSLREVRDPFRARPAGRRSGCHGHRAT